MQGNGEIQQDEGVPCCPPQPFWLKAISCSNVRCVFLAQFRSFLPFLMTRGSDGTNVPVSLQPKPPPRIWVHLMVPFRTMREQDFVPPRWRRKSNESIFTQSVQTFAQTRAAQTTKITNIEQVIGSMLARITSLKTNAACGSESPDSSRSWNVLGRSDGSPATGSFGSHGPGSTDDTRNTRRRFDTSTSPEDEQARSYDSHASNTSLGLRGSVAF